MTRAIPSLTVQNPAIGFESAAPDPRQTSGTDRQIREVCRIAAQHRLPSPVTYSSFPSHHPPVFRPLRSLSLCYLSVERYAFPAGATRSSAPQALKREAAGQTHTLPFYILGDLIAGLQLFFDHALDILELRPSTLRFFGRPFHVLERRRRPVRANLV